MTQLGLSLVYTFAAAFLVLFSFFSTTFGSPTKTNYKVTTMNGPWPKTVGDELNQRSAIIRTKTND